MTNQPVITEYQSQYQEHVVELILSIQQNEYDIPITTEDQPDLFSIEEFYQVRNGNFWVALVEGRAVGTISLLDIGDKRVALRKMFVHKDFRGSAFGTARLLLESAVNWAKEKSVTDIYLGTTPQFLAAHRFYEKNGFIQINRDELPERFPILEVDKRFYRLSL